VGSAAGSTGGNTASAPGVRSDSIKIGIQTSLTGSASSQYKNIVKAVQARFALQNAEGGVFGRKLTTVVVDDQSSETGSLTAAQALSSQSVFGVIAESAFVAGGYRPYQKAGIPVTGGGYDGPEWETPPNTNMFAVGGQYSGYPQYSGMLQFVKEHGGTNIACIGYDVTSSKASADGCVPAAKSVGIKAGYINDSLGFGTVNVTPVALAMKNAHVDSVYMAMDANTNLAIVTAAKQTGVSLKAAMLATGYGQDILDDPTALQAAQGAYFLNQFAPIELKTRATQQFVAAMKTYGNYTGEPTFDVYEGWAGADLMIKGLEVAGQNPTRKSFITNLSKVTNYDAEGLLASPVDFSKFGQPPATECAYYPQLQGNHFIEADSKPVCGSRI
jgi:branched-chain amino acid transport system substrate-binding protein